MLKVRKSSWITYDDYQTQHGLTFKWTKVDFNYFKVEYNENMGKRINCRLF